LTKEVLEGLSSIDADGKKDIDPAMPPVLERNAVHLDDGGLLIEKDSIAD